MSSTTHDPITLEPIHGQTHAQTHRQTYGQTYTYPPTAAPAHDKEHQMFDLDGANALITGAGQGVGREIALTLARNNAGAIVVNDVSAERADAVAQEIMGLGVRALPVVADVTDFHAVARMVEQARVELGPVSVLVNNAGNSGADPSAVDAGAFWEIDPKSWDPYINVNLFGPMNCVRALLPGMIEQQGGRIITIISDAGRVGEAGLEAYSAAKAGAAGFTRAIARSTGRHAITANNIAIAATQTPTTERALEDYDLIRKMMAKYVIRRPGQPSDIAPLVLLLAGPSGAWITGQTYPVNGGFSFNQ